jgi:hypothetical protein
MTVYVDSDGVIADFNKRWNWIFYKSPETMRDELGKEKLWKLVDERDPYFFERLELMPDALELMVGLDEHDPIILTGSPTASGYIQKYRWGKIWWPDHQMIICKAKEKHFFCKPGDILIDDRTKYRSLWEEAKGIFIHHTDAESSLKKFFDLGS